MFGRRPRPLRRKERWDHRSRRGAHRHAGIGGAYGRYAERVPRFVGVATLRRVVDASDPDAPENS